MIQSVDRAIRILLALQGERRLGIAELAVRLELAPSTVHGIVKTLAAHQLGPTVLRLGNVYLDTLELRSRALPWSEELARRTGMAVRTGVLAADEVVIIHHEPRPDGSRQMPESCVWRGFRWAVSESVALRVSPLETAVGGTTTV